MTKKVFSIEKYREIMTETKYYTPEELDNICTDSKGWVKECEGLTEKEMNEIGYKTQDWWMVEVELVEQDIFKEFEKLGYKVKVNEDKILILENLIENITLQINKLTKRYYIVETKTRNAVLISFVEHQLLHRLFEIWGWFDE